MKLTKGSIMESLVIEGLLALKHKIERDFANQDLNLLSLKQAKEYTTNLQDKMESIEMALEALGYKQDSEVPF